MGSAPAYTVAPGETVQFRAFLKASNGTSRDVTNEAAWETHHLFALPVAGPGVFTAALQLGRFSIGVRHDNLYASQDVIVMPPGTYVLGGQVFESRNPPAVVDQAVVTVTTGHGEGQVSGTGVFQPYRLYGLAGPTTIRVFKDGYRTQELRVTVEGHQMLDIDLPLLTPRIDVSGAYTLTVTAASECGVGLGKGNVPEEARSRRYAAAVNQNGPELSVELSGATFSELMRQDSRITGKVEPGRILFDVSWGDAEWWIGPPHIAERLPAGGTVIVNGSVVATASGREIAGNLSGYFSFYAADVAPGASVATAAECFSPSHRFVLSR